MKAMPANMNTTFSGIEKRPKLSLRMMKIKSAQNEKTTKDCCKKKNLKVGFSENARKMKMLEKDAIGRDTRSATGLFRKRETEQRRRRMPTGHRKRDAVKCVASDAIFS
ncbi:hypothetical protein STAS_29678 [Striga asiatica]|uniref:Uncharacterized protein n=1 Tax=Striga asiatica TaxID=4170 RepID=A0A5A7R4A1_STRAF|nr:hypothetical protein STAS_29678 [Striga asiatica]